MTPDQALAQIEALADPAKAAEMDAYHKAARRYLGVPNSDLDRLAKGWRSGLDVPARACVVTLDT